MSTSLNIQQRKNAVQLYYYRHWPKVAICRHLHCSRPWLDRWLARYNPDDVESSLQDHSSAPHHANSPWSADIRQQALEMRRMRMQREQWPYALYGLLSTINSNSYRGASRPANAHDSSMAGQGRTGGALPNTVRSHLPFHFADSA